MDSEAVKLLRDNPTGYFEKERSRDRLPFGFAVNESSKTENGIAGKTGE
ncbi:MAG TPA: hypothetical protein VN888_08845 [Mycobacterium sp.]|nr:hypothetical protein [Mycobacterium sp.]